MNTIKRPYTSLYYFWKRYSDSNPYNIYTTHTYTHTTHTDINTPHTYLPYIYISQSENEVTESCPTLCDVMDCSLPGSSVHGIFQARVLEWVAIPFSDISQTHP